MLYRLSYVGQVAFGAPARMERVMGIEPTSSAWKAEVLPLNYTREGLRAPARKGRLPSADHRLVVGGGFEPPKAEPSDLQSDPFDHSGTPPATKQAILARRAEHVNGEPRPMTHEPEGVGNGASSGEDRDARTHRIRTLDPVRSFLDGAEPVEVRPLDRGARDEFVARTLSSLAADFGSPARQWTQIFEVVCFFSAYRGARQWPQGEPARR